MTSLRLPLRGLHRTVASLLPVTEIVLALVLWIPSVPLQTAVAVAIALLMIAYLVIIARALTFEEPVECSCFGTLASPTVSRLTLGRNLLLTGLGLLTVVAAASGAMTTVLVQAPLALIGLGITVLLASALTALSVGSTAPDASPAPAVARPGSALGPQDAEDAEDAEDAGDAGDAGDAELVDYERSTTPGRQCCRSRTVIWSPSPSSPRSAPPCSCSSPRGAGPANGCWTGPRSGSRRSPPSSRSGSCSPAPWTSCGNAPRNGWGSWRCTTCSSRLVPPSGAAPLRSAVLLGADGLLAGGPVDGGSTVIEFVEEIRSELANAQEQGELPSPAP